MQALTLPARRGWLWFHDGFRIFCKNKLMLSLTLLSYWMLMALLNTIPVLGQIAATVCIPALSVSLMNAARLVEQGAPLLPQVLFSGFSENRRSLLILGGIYMLLALAVLGLSALFDGGALFQLFVTGKEPDEAVKGDVLIAAQVALVVYSPIMMAYWYAPVLAAWHGLSPAKSLFFSLVACLRNWRAFLAYALASMLFGAIIPGFVLGLVGSVFADAMPVSLLMTAIVVLIVAPTLYASFYVSYRDVFVTIDEEV